MKKIFLILTYLERTISIYYKNSRNFGALTLTCNISSLNIEQNKP